MNSERKPCLAACEDQVNLVTETSSSFPNSETFHRREEFCLIIIKLLRTCSTMKVAALTNKFPTLCKHLRWVKKSFDGLSINKYIYTTHYTVSNQCCQMLAKLLWYHFWLVQYLLFRLIENYLSWQHYWCWCLANQMHNLPVYYFDGTFWPITKVMAKKIITFMKAIESKWAYF